MAGRKAAAFALIALAAPALAALPKPGNTPPAAPAAQAAPAAPDVGVTLKQLGFSDAGIAIVKQTQATPDPQVQKLAQARAAAGERMKQVIIAPKFDLAAFGSAYDALSATTQQLSQYGGAKDKALLARLPAVDQPLFAKVMLGLVRRVPAPGAPAPKK